MKVAEVWRFDGESVVIEQLREDGADHRVESSQFMPIRAAEVPRWILGEDSVEMAAWSRMLRAWVRAELKDRARGQ